MTEQEFITYARQVGTKYPQLQSFIQEVYELALYEIEDGESPEHEWELAEGSIAERVEDLGTC